MKARPRAPKTATPSRSAPHGHFPLDDLVRRSAVDHRLAGECLPAVRTMEISLGIVLDDSILEALDQPTRATLSVLVQQLAAGGTVDPNRPCTSSRSHLDRTVTDRVRTAKRAACYAPETTQQRVDRFLGFAARPSLEELFSDVSDKAPRNERIHEVIRLYR